jgi:mono/diheme cytochrome c family protein
VRRRAPFVLIVLILALIVVWLLVTRNAAPPQDLALGPNAVELGATVYAENCADCHGVDLAGEPGFNWRKRKPDGTFPGPPHDETGHTWHHPDGLLIEMITKGGAQFLGGRGVSTMPGFEDVLSEREIASVLAFIKSAWPEHIQDRQRQATEVARE